MKEKNIPTLIAKNLKKYRHEKGLSQIELASKSDIHFTYISQIERGLRKDVSFRIIYKLAQTLDKNMDDFVR